MDIDIKKNGKLTLKDTPYFEPIDNTNISFTNMDIGTARITFRIMKHGLPLQVSDKNVYVYAYLESSNGSRAEVIELNFDDPINGLVSLQLDKEFLLAATNTTVTGQLYISMHKWNTVSDDFSDTVALQEFTFTVKDALVNQISGVTKIQYIRTFDQLKTEVKDRILELEEEVGRIETVSNELKELFRTTTQDIKDLKARTIAELDSKIASSSLAVDDKKTAILSELNTATTNAINQINNKKEEVLQLITDNNLVTNDMFVGFQNDIQETMDETLGEYLSQVNAVRDEFQLTLDNLNWQKYKLTEKDGTTPVINNFDFNIPEDVLNYSAGTYYIRGALNSTSNNIISNYGYLTISTTYSTKSVADLTFVPIGTNSLDDTSIYKCKKNGNWGNWNKVTQTQADTGWVPFQSINGTVANDAFKEEVDNGFDCAYRVIDYGDRKEKHVRINVRNVLHQTIVAELPKDFAKNVQFHYVRVPINKGYGLVGLFPNGSLYVYVESDKRETWNETDYFYGEFSWVE